MADFAAVRDGLKARLDTIDGLRAYDTVPATMEPPAIVVAPAGGTFLIFNSSMDNDSADVRLTLWLLVSSSWDRTAQDKIDGFLAGAGPTSIRAAVEDTPVSETQWAAITGVSNYGQIMFAGLQYWGCQFHVTVGVV
jgi:hypothetical protein